MLHLLNLSALALALTVSSLPAEIHREVKVNGADPHAVTLRMPNVKPIKEDSYLCVGSKMDSSKTAFITGFSPQANANNAHHMLLFGCADIYAEEGAWNCGEMQDASDESRPVCASGMTILYAWAMDAPALELPKGVGFAIGGSTGINYLVLQVHYKQVGEFQRDAKKTDTSGIVLAITSTPQPKLAAVYLIESAGQIAPHSTVFMEAACSLQLHRSAAWRPFAFRVHTHSLGRVVAGYRVRDGQWTEIGRMSPQRPQMFYNISHPGMDIRSGDMLAARCTMQNDGEHVVNIGQTQKDEMCNFYLMYWTDATKPRRQSGRDPSVCMTAGPPNFSFASLERLVGSIVPDDASLIPGDSQVMEDTANLLNEANQMMKESDGQFSRRISELLENLREPSKHWNDNYEDDELKPTDIEEQFNWPPRLTQVDMLE